MLLLAGIVAFLICAMLMPPLIRAAHHFGLLSVPDGGRRRHRDPIPLVGGIAIFLAISITISLHQLLAGGADGGWTMLVVLGGATALFALGLVDDVHRLSATTKLLVEIPVIALVVAGGLRIDALTITPDLVLQLPFWLSLLISGLWLLGVTNTFNLIDGSDGVGGGVALIAALALAVVSLGAGGADSLLLNVVVAAAAAAFLFYNAPPATVFLGDAGSLLLGFCTAASALVLLQQAPATPALFPVVLLALPILDAFLAAVRRIRRGVSPLVADHGHVHHRLRRLGCSRLGVALVLNGLSLVFALLALGLPGSALRATTLVVLAVLIVIGWFMRLLRRPTPPPLRAGSRDTRPEWHFITGEFPPVCGGVGDHTARIAAALAARGERVHVWCPAAGSPDQATRSLQGVHVHRLSQGFGFAGLLALGRQLDRCAPDRRVVIAYTPNVFGWRGLNVAFCTWLLLRRYRSKRATRVAAVPSTHEQIEVLFHEPFFYFGWRQPQRNILAITHRLMAALLLLASHRVYVTVPAWKRLLRPFLLGRAPRCTWLPVPSTIPLRRDPAAVQAIRAASGIEGAIRLGHFGTTAGAIGPLLEQTIVQLLMKQRQVVMVFIGRDGAAFGEKLRARHSRLAHRIITTGLLDPRNASLWIQSLDLALQPYPDGASSRRTSLMAMLSHAVPVVTTDGRFTEVVWREPGAPTLTQPIAAALADACHALIHSRAILTAEGDAGSVFYRRHFSLSRSMRVLRNEAAARRPTARATAGAG